MEKNMAEIYSKYQKELISNDALDFDDLLLYPLELFDNNPKVLLKYQKQWRYILVDEYQDTNRLSSILTKLSENIGKFALLVTMINLSWLARCRRSKYFRF